MTTRKPRAITKCVANAYTGPTERIVEFSFPGTDGPAGGLMRLAYRNGQPHVELYRVEGCVVNAPVTDEQIVAEVKRRFNFELVLRQPKVPS